MDIKGLAQELADMSGLRIMFCRPLYADTACHEENALYRPQIHTWWWPYEAASNAN
jgi:hypothetical protein